MKRVRHYHVIFALSLLCLAALVAWWTVFLNGAVSAERQAAIAELQHQALESALRLGHRERPPTLADLPAGAELELLPCDDGALPGAVPVEPLYVELCLQPATEAVGAIHAKMRRRRAMVHGEGSFLVLLLGVCTVMLFQLVRSERRHLRRMESFIHAVTHEMKTPLTGIKTLLETLRAGRVPQAAQARLFELGLENCERLEHSIENVLVAGALRSGQQQVRVVALPLRLELDAFLEHRRRTLTGRPDAVRVAAGEDVDELTVLADPDLLRIVLENLVDNGLKYGGDEPAVVLEIRAGKGTVDITVRDGGVGFDSATARQLFVPFRRAMKSGHGVQHGTGLGLSIARDLCRRMSGDLRAHSDGPGKGATFTVTLPIAAMETQA